jgi:tetratricopeptide (TPR) repeat protein
LNDFKGDLVSINSFLSISKVDEIAKLFISPTSENHQSVLFIIDVDMYLKRTISADISSMSNTPEECEVLFVFPSVFKVVDVRRPPLTAAKTEITLSGDSTTHYWIVYLMASDEGRERLDEYRELLRKNDAEDDPEITLGRLEIEMGEFTKAADYFTTLLARTPAEKGINRSKICQLHARALYRLAKYDEALTKLKEGLEILDNANISHENPTYMRCQFHIANVYVFKSEYDRALELYTNLLNVQRKILHEDHQHIADTLSGLSWLNGKRGNIAEALKFNIEALRIKTRVLSADHPMVTESYKALGAI